MTPRVLFVTPGFEDYLSDGILHGLRELLGAYALDALEPGERAQVDALNRRPKSGARRSHVHEAHHRSFSVATLNRHQRHKGPVASCRSR